MTDLFRVLGEIVNTVGIGGLILICLLIFAVGFFWYKINKSSNQDIFFKYTIYLRYFIFTIFY